MEIAILFLIGILQRFIGTLAGGGGLISFPAMLLLGVPVHATIAANKLSTTFGAFTNFLVLIKNKEISGKHFWFIAPFAILGGVLGSMIATVLSEAVLTVVAVTLLCFAFGLAFLKKPEVTATFTGKITKKMYAAFLGTSTYNGAFGPGQGTVLLYLLLYQRISYISAIGFSQINTFISSAAATIIFISTGSMVWHIAIPLTVGSIFGGQIAIRLAYKLSRKHVRWLLHIITFFLIVQLIWKLF
ncbi:MAG TPA: sulfite exporter TauE/SafE family protein [Pseudogracilibacillus sp.]|nr:sulfite exporter TauE/SafE family protein [Pseudogracilibacillus sp.]